MEPNKLNSYDLLQKKCDNSNAKLVLPERMVRSKFVLVGESLGLDEHLEGEYFVGDAGRLLNRLLGDVGLMRSIVHITNLIKVRPPDNKVSRLGELGLTIEDFLPYLKEELSIVQPKVILAVGRHAAQALCNGVDSVVKHRGTTLDCKLDKIEAPVVITLHPSYLRRGNMHLYPYVRHDIKTFANLGFGLTKRSSPYVSHVDPSFNESMNFLRQIEADSTETCYDIETVARSHITCIGYTLNKDEAMCIPFRHQGLKNRWSYAEHIMLVRQMQKIHNSPKITKIGQNINYDNYYLLPLLGAPREPLIDTMYAHWLLHPDAPHNLGFIMSVYTDMPYHKDDAKNWEMKTLPHTQALWNYNVADVIGTHRGWHGLRSDLQDLNMYEFFVGYIMPFRRVLFEMEVRGLRVDKAQMEEWREFVETDELPCWLERVNKYFFGANINPNSSKQLGEALSSIWKLPIQRTAKGNFTLNNDRLVELKVQFPKFRNLLDDIKCARTTKSKTLGTYLHPDKLSPDGRMRCSFGTTVTGRQSSSSNAKDEGMNLQNQPKQFRRLYLPEEGQVFIEPDLSSAEAFVMVCMMKLTEIKERMFKGEKIHSIVGEWIYEKPAKKLTPEEYLTSKKTVHGSNYKLGERKFAILIEKPVAIAKTLRAKYAAIMPALSQYHSEIERRIKYDRIIRTPYGRVRTFTGLPTDETFRSGYAQIPQSTVVDTLNIGALGLWVVKPDDIYLAMQCHDGLLISLPPNKVEWFKPYIRTHLETLRPLDIEGVELTIPLDIGETKTNWLGED